MLPFAPIDAPPGFLRLDDFLSREEEAALLASLAAIPLHDVRMRDVVAKRRVAHFGVGYGYESWSLVEAPPVPAFLVPWCARAAAEIGVVPGAIAEVLCSFYPAGAGIGWHRDAPMFGPSVFGLSLGTAATMRFRRSRERVPRRRSIPVVLPPRSAYVLAGEARSGWQHSIPAVEAPRWSITFRTLREETMRPDKMRQYPKQAKSNPGKTDVLQHDEKSKLTHPPHDPAPIEKQERAHRERD